MNICVEPIDVGIIREYNFMFYSSLDSECSSFVLNVRRYNKLNFAF